jgi:L-aspartate oxidase
MYQFWIHGANRLASNSLLEGLVFGHNAAMKTVELLNIDEFNYFDLKMYQNGMMKA